MSMCWIGDRRVGVRDVELADVRVGVAHRDLLLEVDRRLVAAPHQVRHDALGRREVAHQVAVGTPPEHGRGCYSSASGEPAPADGGTVFRVAFADLLAHPDVVEEQVLAPPGLVEGRSGSSPCTAGSNRATAEIAVRGGAALRARRGT